MGKLHYFTALLVVILLAIASTWVFESIKKNPFIKKEIVRHDPDYFLENFTATTMDLQGKLNYKVTAIYLEHYPDDNSMTLQYPIFTFYKNEVKRWTARADEALIFQETKTIYLTGNVVMIQLANKKENLKLATLTAEQLTIEANENRLHTKTKIKLVQGNNHIQAVGMKADMSINKIEFLSKTRSHYASPEK